MSGWIFALQLAAMVVAVLGAVVSTRGRRRAQEGAALAHAASTLESQLTRPPGDVIAEALRGRAMAHSGAQLARRGLWIAAGGCAASLALAAFQILS